MPPKKAPKQVPLRRNPSRSCKAAEPVILKTIKENEQCELTTPGRTKRSTSAPNDAPKQPNSAVSAKHAGPRKKSAINSKTKSVPLSKSATQRKRPLREAISSSSESENESKENDDTSSSDSESSDSSTVDSDDLPSSDSDDSLDDDFVEVAPHRQARSKVTSKRSKLSAESPTDFSEDTSSDAPNIKTDFVPASKLPRKGESVSSSPPSKKSKNDKKQDQPAEVKLLYEETSRQATMTNKLVYHHPELAEVEENLKKASLNRKKLLDPSQIEVPGLKTRLLPFQLAGLAWMLRQEEEAVGGILADEMGMGKTVSAISLLLCRRKSPVLVIVPASAAMQWISEFENHVLPGRLRVMLYHSVARQRASTAAQSSDNKSGESDICTSLMIEFAAHDVVVTTYSMVESAYRRMRSGFTRRGVKVFESSALHSTEWGRIVLDEAHAIKDTGTGIFSAVLSLKTTYKWALTGTPVQNRVGDLYSIVRFFKVVPFSRYYCADCPCESDHWQFTAAANYTSGHGCPSCGHVRMRHVSFWSRFIVRPVTTFHRTSKPFAEGYSLLKAFLEFYMIRRTKTEKGIVGELGIPPKTVGLRRVFFGPAEHVFYQSVFRSMQEKVTSFVDDGSVLVKYVNVLKMITRLRQAADHPELVLVGNRMHDSNATKAKSIDICNICNDTPEDPVVSRCTHVFCRSEIANYIAEEEEKGNTAPKCPVCFARLIVDVSNIEVVAPRTRKPTIMSRMSPANFRSSAKLEALVQELENLRRRDYTAKAIVFSQYVAFLDLIAFRLRKGGFKVAQFTGGMTLEQRAAVISEFKTSPYVNVVLVSLRAGGVALNLTAANHVFLMDPWWNPAVEAQAMDRIHRLGQHRPVYVTRIVVQGSIEERILQLQEKKNMLFQFTVGRDESALSRLSVDDIMFLFKIK